MKLANSEKITKFVINKPFQNYQLYNIYGTALYVCGAKFHELIKIKFFAVVVKVIATLPISRLIFMVPYLLAKTAKV